jgi:hypothetical protein
MTRRNYNPRTRRLLSLAESTKVLRLTKADRKFLRDLGKIQIISAAQAAEHHYSHLKTQGTQSLQRLEDAGILRSRNIYIAGQGRVKTFEFSSHEMAIAWGGRLPRTGSSRSDYHELITAEAYFRLNRPEDFRLASRFSKSDRNIIGEHLPDAAYSDQMTGELIVFEADAGNYSKQQIQQKSLSWERRGLKQVWAQPEKATSKIEASEQLNVLIV